MTDMSQVIVPKSDQLNSDDLIAGPRTIKVTKVELRPGTEQPTSIFFEGDGGKPWKCCKSMSRILVAVWGRDASTYVGKSVTIYRDPKVRFGGAEVGGIRISHASHITEAISVPLTQSRASRKLYTVQPLATNSQPTAEDKAAQEAFDALLQEAYGATTLEGVNEIAKKATPLSRSVQKAKKDEMRDIVTKKRAEFTRQPGEEG